MLDSIIGIVYGTAAGILPQVLAFLASLGLPG